MELFLVVFTTAVGGFVGHYGFTPEAGLVGAIVGFVIGALLATGMQTDALGDMLDDIDD